MSDDVEIRSPTMLVWTLSKSTGTTRVVALALAKHASNDGYLFPGMPLICKMCGPEGKPLAERTARENIQWLVDHGEFARLESHGRGHATLYRLLLGLPEGSGDREVMLRWLATQMSPHLAELYQRMTRSAESGGDPPVSGKRRGSAGISGQKAADLRQKAADLRQEKRRISAGTPGAIRKELSIEEEDQGLFSPAASGQPANNGKSGESDEPVRVSARTLFGAYLDLKREQSGNLEFEEPPEYTGMITATLKNWLKRGIDPPEVEAVLRDYARGGGHPSQLPQILRRRRLTAGENGAAGDSAAVRPVQPTGEVAV